MHPLKSLIGTAIFLIAGVAPPLTITDSGYWVTVVDDNGTPSLVRITTVIDLRSGEAPTPPKDDPGETPPALDPPPAGISADVASWSETAADPAGAQKYVLIFETAIDGVTDGSVDGSTLFEVLKKSADELLDENWESFRRRLGDHLTKLVQQGDLDSKLEITRQLELIRYGLAYSARDAEKIDEEEAISALATILRVIKVVSQ